LQKRNAGKKTKKIKWEEIKGRPNNLFDCEGLRNVYV
jgi:hypothetical protein